MSAAKSSPAEREPRADAGLKNLPRSKQEELWLMRHPEDEDATPLTYTEILAILPRQYGISASPPVLSEFFKWLRMKKDMESASERAIQARIELAKDPTLTPADLERAGQIIFTMETMDKKDVKGYVALASLRLQAETVAQNKTRLEQNERRIDNDERRIRLLEEAARDAKAKLQAITTEAKSKGGLSAETLAAIEEAAGLL